MKNDRRIGAVGLALGVRIQGSTDMSRKTVVTAPLPRLGNVCNVNGFTYVDDHFKQNPVSQFS